MTEAERVAAALRCLDAGIRAALQVLESDKPARKNGALAAFPRDCGVSVTQASLIFKEHGLDARSLGGYVRRGWLRREQDPGADRLSGVYYLTELGAKRSQV